jgi:pimeloyl-ACP methyl ester carboxylesterase
MAEQLQPDGQVYIEDVVITTPGLTGEVEVYRPGSQGMRGEEQKTEAFQDALDSAGMAEQLSVVISRHQSITPAEGTRGSGGADDIIVNVPAPGDGHAQVLLYAAEDGSLSWHFADDVPPEALPERGGERRTYRVPRAIVPPTERDPAATRGVLGAVGTKILKVLVFPLVDPLLGKVGDFFASKWEAKHRLNRVRWMTVDGFRSGDAASFTDADWATVRQGRALLFVHGTFSTAQGGFGHLPRETMAALHTAYNGRVLAFDHHSVSVSPKENAAFLASLVPDGPALQVDVVTHSRGGLVGRELASAGDLDVRGLVMVASPNAGTVLADRKHLSDLLDRVTDLAQFVPDAGVSDTLGLVLAVLKQLAVGAVGGLDGITAMDPGGGYLAELNSRPAPDALSRAVAADYEPPRGAPLARVARDGATDLVFREIDNDLVVPTRGCWDVDGAAGFPLGERFVFDALRGVDHNSFFGQEEVSKRLLEWLPTA